MNMVAMMMIIIILLLLFENGLASFSSPEPLGLICSEHLVSRPRDQETTGSGRTRMALLRIAEILVKLISHCPQ